MQYVVAQYNGLTTSHIFGISPPPLCVSLRGQRFAVRCGRDNDGSAGSTVGEVDLLDDTGILLVGDMVYQRAAVDCTAVVGMAWLKLAAALICLIVRFNKFYS